jgi:hypothetical protein
MRADATQVVALEPDHGSDGSLLDDSCHVLGGDVLVGCVQADDGIRVGRIARACLDKTTSTSFDRTQRVSRQGVVVQSGVTLTILLVVEGAASSSESVERCESRDATPSGCIFQSCMSLRQS